MPVTKGTQGKICVGGKMVGGKVVGGKKIAEIDSWSCECTADVSKRKLRRFLRKLRPWIRYRVAHIMAHYLTKWGYATLEYETFQSGRSTGSHEELKE